MKDGTRVCKEMDENSSKMKRCISILLRGIIALIIGVCGSVLGSLLVKMCIK